MATPTSNPTPRAGADLDDPGAMTGVREAASVRDAGQANGAPTSRGAAGAERPTNGAAEPAAQMAAMAGSTAPPATATAPATAPVADRALPAAPDTGAHRQRPAEPVGRPQPDLETVPPHARGGKRRRLWLLAPILLVALTAAALFGYRYWYQTTYFVTTENASITGDLVQVGSLNAGRIVATRVDVGRPVREGQEIAVVAMPREVGGVAAGAAPRMGITGTEDSLVPVYSPLNGIVAARMGHVGGTVTAGQPIYALIDPDKVWIKANVEETDAWRVQVGQPAEIHLDALNRDLVGYVDAITPASAATFSLLPASNASGNFTKVTQYVPVKIVVDTRGIVLPLGTSVTVRIQVREPGSAFPLPWQP